MTTNERWVFPFYFEFGPDGFFTVIKQNANYFEKEIATYIKGIFEEKYLEGFLYDDYPLPDFSIEASKEEIESFKQNWSFKNFECKYVAGKDAFEVDIMIKIYANNEEQIAACEYYVEKHDECKILKEAQNRKYQISKNDYYKHCVLKYYRQLSEGKKVKKYFVILYKKEPFGYKIYTTTELPDSKHVLYVEDFKLPGTLRFFDKKSFPAHVFFDGDSDKWELIKDELTDRHFTIFVDEDVFDMKVFYDRERESYIMK